MSRSGYPKPTNFVTSFHGNRLKFDLHDGNGEEIENSNTDQISLSTKNEFVFCLNDTIIDFTLNLRIVKMV